MTAREKPGLRSALSAFGVGFVLCLLVTVLGAFYRKEPLAQTWLNALLTSLAVGLVLGIGGAIAGRLLGAVLGGAAGVVLAAFLAVAILPLDKRVIVEEPLPKGSLFELSGPTLDGKTIDLGDYRGKVVLVDFWGSWCLPCQAEIPHLKAAYARFHDRGFEIIGVSNGDSRSTLEAFIREHQMPWPQIFFPESSKVAVENPLAVKHEVTGFPTTFLIDQQGRLVARDLRGASIEEVVDRVLQQGGMFYRVQLNRLSLLVLLAIGALLGAVFGAVVQRKLLGTS